VPPARRRRHAVGVALLVGVLLALGVWGAIWERGRSDPTGAADPGTAAVGTPPQSAAAPRPEPTPPETKQPGEPSNTPAAPAGLRLLQVMPAALTLKPEQTQRLEVQIERQNTRGAVNLELDGLPATVRAPPVVVPLDKDSATLELTAAADAEPLSQVVQVRARLGDLHDDKAVLLTVQVPPALRVLALAPVTVEAGKSATLKVQVERKHAPGPIEVSFPDPPTGVRLGAAVIAKGASTTEVELTADPGAEAVTGQRVTVHVAGDTEAQGEFRLTVRRAAVVLEDTKPLGMKFVKVPRGTFWMGGGGGKPGDRQVEIKRDFYLAIHETTQEQWQAVMGSNPSFFSRTGGGRDLVKDISDTDLKQFPVDNVSWNDMQDFVQKLNTREKGSGWLYRLPTEEEWE
jgi:formylglycine-generating enzyme required for sulfatase activity